MERYINENHTVVADVIAPVNAIKQRMSWLFVIQPLVLAFYTTCSHSMQRANISSTKKINCPKVEGEDLDCVPSLVTLTPKVVPRFVTKKEDPWLTKADWIGGDGEHLAIVSCSTYQLNRSCDGRQQSIEWIV